MNKYRARYLFTIGHLPYLALRDGPRCFQPGFSCRTVLRVVFALLLHFVYRTLTFFGWAFLPLRLYIRLCFLKRPSTPIPRFGLFPFRSPLLRASFLLSFPPGTEMFHFPGSRLYFKGRSCQRWGSRFGGSRNKVSLPEGGEGSPLF